MGSDRSRVEGSAFLALFLVAWQWGPLFGWGRQKRLVAVPDHRPDRGGDEVREAGLVRVLAGHRVGGQLADVHRGTELEVAGPVQGLRHLRTGPPSRPHCPGHPPSTANVRPPSPAPFSYPGHGAAGADPGCGLLAQGASRPPYPKPARLPTCCPGVLSRASCSYFILAM